MYIEHIVNKIEFINVIFFFFFISAIEFQFMASALDD